MNSKTNTYKNPHIKKTKKNIRLEDENKVGRPRKHFKTKTNNKNKYYEMTN